MSMNSWDPHAYQSTNRHFLLFVALLMSATLATSRSWAESEKEAHGIKNVLLLVADDLRANVLGCYGNTICQTPNIDRLAKNGVTFQKAYCQGTSCAPSRTSFMRSRYRDTKNVTLGEHLQSEGVHSGRVGKIFHMRVPGDIIAGTNGKDIEACWTERHNSSGQEAHTPGDYACLNLNIFTKELAGRQSTRMPHRMFVEVQYDGDGSDQPDHKTATKTIELLNENKDRRFFLAAGFVRPHYPMVAPRTYWRPYPWEKITVPPVVPNDLDDIPKLGWASSRSDRNGIANYPDNQKRMWAAYFAAVAFMDEQVGRILDELDRLGLTESTAIIFTSDHGYHLGDHTFWQKSNLHEQVTRVPLVISYPQAAKGSSKSVVELVDLYPTVCDLMGSKIPDAVQGKSLVPVIRRPRERVKEGALSFAKGISWRTSDWSYMRYPDGSEELYQMSKDSAQFDNLAGDERFAEQKTILRNQLDEQLSLFGLKAGKNSK